MTMTGKEVAKIVGDQMEFNASVSNAIGSLARLNDTLEARVKLLEARIIQLELDLVSAGLRTFKEEC